MWTRGGGGGADTPAGPGLTMRGVADSAARVLAGTCPGGADWGGAERAAWLVVALAAPAVFEKHEGGRYSDCARELRGLFHDACGAGPVEGAGSETGPVAALRWEAVARHLHCLLDNDDVGGPDDLPALEAGWNDWLVRRVHDLTLSN